MKPAIVRDGIGGRLPTGAAGPAAFLALFCALLPAARTVRAAESGPLEIRLRSGGLERTCLVHAPANRSAAAMPLLLVLHGGSGTADGMVTLTQGRFDALADRDGFVVGYPQGVGRSWNDGRRDLPSRATLERIDDVGFFRELVADLSRRFPIDRRRVFVAGISNGGIMALRLACELPRDVRGVAAVGASLARDLAGGCRAPSAVSVVEIAGTTDPIVPYAGGEVRALGAPRGAVLGAPSTAELWAAKAACRAPAVETDLPAPISDGTRVRKIERPGCASGARVVLYRVEGGGHAWPGGRPYLSERLIGKTSRNLSACDAIWEIFSGLK
ncbi:MAG TPA: PHB depolymerase family esterase [Thermoanaerobaculia bacterium]|nr:PHB depolymerase family esterase [Thermoanaerobaculia bacterium]